MMANIFTFLVLRIGQTIIVWLAGTFNLKFKVSFVMIGSWLQKKVSVFDAYLIVLLPYFLLPAQNYHANVTLTFTTVLLLITNATYEILGVFVNDKSNAREVSSVHHFCLWESFCELQFQRLRSLFRLFVFLTETNNF